MNNVEIQPHIKISKCQTQPVVIVVGDPARAESIAKMCDNYKELAWNREYRSFDCSVGNKKITVCSHGVGSAGAAICFEELMKNGAEIIIRAGTAGSLQPQMHKRGDIICCYAAAREDGVSKLTVPAGYPAVADPYVFSKICEIAANKNIKIKHGIALTNDLFYKSKIIEDPMFNYAKANIDIVEMEIATLFVIAKLNGVRAGALCVVDGSPFKWDEGDYSTTDDIYKKSVQEMLRISIDTSIVLLSELNKPN